MNIRLEKISSSNFEEVLSLEVFEEQKNFVSTPAYALAQAYVYYETAYPFAIYKDDTIIGFIMFGFYESRKQYTLWKFLIGKQYQNKGYGKAALLQGIQYMRECFGISEMYTGASIENSVAQKLYEAVGFKKTGLIELGMVEMRLDMD